MPRAIAGVLIEVDESIMAIIDKINKAHEHAFILEPIDDRHALIRPNKLDELKELLREELKDTVREPEDSSESE